MDIFYNIKNTYVKKRNEIFNDYIITYGYYNKIEKKTITFYNYDNIFYIIYLLFLSLFFDNIMKTRCMTVRDFKHLKEENISKNNSLIPFGIYYFENIKYGFLNKINLINESYKNKILYFILDDKINLSKYFEIFYYSLKSNNIHSFTYEDFLCIIFSLIYIDNISYNIIKIFYIKLFEEKSFKKEDKIIIYE